MKQIFTLLALTALMFNTSAQDKLSVEYEHKMKFDIEAMEKNLSIGSDIKVAKQEVMDALKDAMEKESYYILLLTPTESEFKYTEKIRNDQPSEARVMISFGGRSTTYKNLNENISLRAENAWNKNQIVRDTLKAYDWKISRESKEILGYEVRKAETQIDSTKSAIAWYAPKLSYKNGPLSYQGLPGLILEIEIKDDSDEEKRTETYKAISISVDSKNTPIERPKKGTIVTPKEFEAFLKEQSDRMKNMYEGGVDKE